MGLNLKQFCDNSLTDKDEWHSYLPTYDRILSHLLQQSQLLNILGIGIQRGGCVKMWLASAPRCSVLGLDLLPCPEFLKKEYRYQHISMNAYLDSSLEIIKRFNKFDLITEDGSHKPEHILYVAKNYPHFLNHRGILVIEDIPSADLVPQILEIIPSEFRGTFIDLREVKGRWDDMMVVVQRK